MCTIISVSEKILKQNSAGLVSVMEAVHSPPLDQSLSVAVHVSVEQTRKPFLQHRVSVIHHLTQQHPACRGAQEVRLFCLSRVWVA